MNDQLIRVLIVDDHPLIIGGIKYFVGKQPDMTLVGSAASGAEGLALSSELAPDVVLMDIFMPDMDGVAATQALKQSHSDIKVLILTALENPAVIRRAIAAGAIGYLRKDTPLQDVVQAVRLAYAGQSILSVNALDLLLVETDVPQPPKANLTKREQQVLALIVKGMSNDEIAQKLVVSISTVRFHITNIFAKLETSNRAETAALAIQHNLLGER